MPCLAPHCDTQARRGPDRSSRCDAAQRSGKGRRDRKVGACEHCRPCVLYSHAPAAVAVHRRLLAGLVLTHRQTAPTSAADGESISGMPGEPFGPSYLTPSLTSRTLMERVANVTRRATRAIFFRCTCRVLNRPKGSATECGQRGPWAGRRLWPHLRRDCARRLPRLFAVLWCTTAAAVCAIATVCRHS